MPRLTTKSAPSRSRSRHPAEFQIALPGLSQVGEAVAQLAGSGIEARGAIFTRREVVDFILDLVGYREGEPLLERRLLEPSFGNGDFLFPALDRLHGVPAIGPLRAFADAGGLMSYGANIPEITRQAGIYTGRVLKGAKPAELPVVQPAKFELVINLKAAKALGLTVPLTLQVAADEVIE